MDSLIHPLRTSHAQLSKSKRFFAIAVIFQPVVPAATFFVALSPSDS